MLNQHGRVRILATAFLAAALVVLLPSAFGQNASHQVMVVNDDGSGPMIRHFSMPDLMDLRTPDFIQRDLPIFQEKLVLSEAQAAAIERQITVYLEAFEQLKKSLLNVPGAEPMIISGTKMAGEDGQPGEGQEGAFVFAPAGGELPMISLDELAEMGEGEMSLDIGVRMMAEDDEGGAWATDDTGPSVSVEFQNSEDLPEEVRKQLEEHAKAMAERITAQLEQQRAKAADGGEAASPLLPPMGDISKIEERQAKIAEAAKEFRKAKTQLRHEFVTEAQTTLTPTQVERWPALERALLREKSLPKGRLSGERTDLYKIVKPMTLDQAQLAAIAPHLDAYDLELDGALRQRDTVLEDVGPKIDKAMSEQDFDRALAAIDRATAARVAVRSINERYIDAISGLLAADVASAFRNATSKAAYPRIYRATFADKTFAAAYKIEGLDEQTAARVREFEQAYRVEREEYDARIRRAIDKHQPLEPRRPIEHMKSMQAGERSEGMGKMLGADDPIREAYDKRRELDERYAKQIASVLTPEQVAQLPKPPAVRKPGEPIIIRRTTGE
jgi:hypothetical protein